MNLVEKIEKAGLKLETLKSEWERNQDLSITSWNALKNVGITKEEVLKFVEENADDIKPKKSSKEQVSKEIQAVIRDNSYNDDVQESVEDLKKKQALKPKKIIETSCPLPMEVLKEYFQDKENTAFKINYRAGKLDANALMIYLSNLNLDADFDEETYNDRDALKELVAAYMSTTTALVDIEQLAREALAVCCQYMKVLKPMYEFGTNIPTVDQEEIDEFCDDPLAPYMYFERLNNAEDFIEENLDIVKRWCEMLDSSPIFNFQCLNIPEFNEFVEKTFEEVDDPDYVGINFVNTYALPWIGYYIGSIGDRKGKIFTNQFNEYRFKGRNMFSYFDTEANTLCVQTKVIAAGKWDECIPEELKKNVV